MHLKKIEFLGFKSFAQKTVLSFSPGVTAIVGPNGSGKSNVIDALRWVLGERDAKNIRADKSENLIFSGTPQRPRASMAQVSITLDNSTRFFPIDYSEVNIRRRVVRGGTSTYFLNDSEVRLKDVVGFFSQARLGTRGFSIINQGSSDIFLTASPQERRSMMEEILGLRQYQLKRHEAERKLESTNINLDKVSAMIEELLPHLRLLRRQTKKWEKHGEVLKELSELEKHFFSFQLAEIEKDRKKIVLSLSSLAREEGVALAQFNELTEKLKKVESAQPQGDKNFNEFKKKQTDLLNRRAQIQKEIGRLEAEAEFVLSRPKTSLKEAELSALISEIKSEVQNLLGEKDAIVLKKRLEDLLKKIDSGLEGESVQSQNRKREIDDLRKKFSEELFELEKNLSELSELEKKLAQEMREFNLVFKKAFEQMEEKRKELSVLEARKSKLNFEQEKLDIRLEDLEKRAQQYGRSLQEFSSAFAPSAFNQDEAERKILKLRGELASIGEIDENLLKEAKDTEERYAFLSGQVEDLKKAAKDLSQLIKDLTEKLHTEFSKSLSAVNEEFNKHFRAMFNGGKAKLHLVKKEKPVLPEEENETDKEAPSEEERSQKEEKPDERGLEIEVSIPRKNIRGLDMLSGGERSLVSIAAIFALISVSPPPFLVLDEVDAALDENNTKRFADLVESFSKNTQFIIVTHNRATMGAANTLYGVTMGQDGTSRVLSVRMEDVDNDLIPQKP